MSKRAAVITDIDNTLYNFVDFFAPAFRAMLHALALKTGFAEEEFLPSFRNVYARYHSLEYPYSIQELEILRNSQLSAAEIESAIHAATVAFGRSRNRRLVAYPGVKTTLEWLNKQGYFVIAYTDGPAGHTLRRLQRLGLERHFDCLVAWGPTRDETGGPFDLSQDKVRHWFIDVAHHESVSRHFPVKYVSPTTRKPNLALLHEIISEYRLEIESTWFIGDSVPRDLIPAREAGFRDVLARYGWAKEDKNWQTLVSISPWHDSAIQRELRAEDAFEPQYIIDSFSALKTLLPHIQLNLPLT
jgi:phosphoglycolate phosphatase